MLDRQVSISPSGERFALPRPARLVDVIIKCEDVFGITIEDDEADKIRTIGDAVELVKKKQ